MFPKCLSNQLLTLTCTQCALEDEWSEKLSPSYTRTQFQKYLNLWYVNLIIKTDLGCSE